VEEEEVVMECSIRWHENPQTRRGAGEVIVDMYGEDEDGVETHKVLGWFTCPSDTGVGLDDGVDRCLAQATLERVAGAEINSWPISPAVDEQHPHNCGGKLQIRAMPSLQR
jgi:hypothetical protein